MTMNVNWEVIEHFCISVAVVGAAITYMYKGIKFAKKPSDDVNEKLDRDNKRLIKLEDHYDYVVGASTLTMKTLLLVLEELKVNNDTEGQIKKAQDEIHNFIFERK